MRLSFIALIIVLLSGFNNDAIAQAKATIKGGQLVTTKTLSFKGNTTTLTEDGKEAVLEIKEFLAAKEDITLVRVEGHVAGTDNNQQLSEAMAKEVVARLVAAGIDCKRMVAVGFGDTKPVSEQASENTRITVAMAMLRGRAIGGMPVDGGGQVVTTDCK